MNAKKPKVTLLSWTGLPLETVYAVWEASKDDAPLRTPEQIRAEVPHHEVASLFKRVIDQGIPIGEHLNFVFMMEHISVSWREHAVRHRIGVCPSPERLGADIQMLIDSVPDRSSSSYWSQSARILDMGHFADNGDYRVPQSLLEHADAARLVEKWREHMLATQSIYREFTEAGVPMEDAREAMPIAMQHRMSWSLNLQAMRHILRERGCWILQLGIWGPIIEGMIKELVEKVDPVFADLVSPPCLTGHESPGAMVERWVQHNAELGASVRSLVAIRGAALNGGSEYNAWLDKQPPAEWVGCRFHEENRRRYAGVDRLPPCSLHFHYHATAEQKATTVDLRAMNEHADKRRVFWQRDPWTGRRLAKLNVVG